MILTAVKYVNARLGKPSVNASNPRYLIPGDKVSVKSKVLGDSIENNNEWILTAEDEFFSSQGFQITDEFRVLPFFEHLQTRPPLFSALEISELWSNTKQGQGVNVGIIDNGVLNHPSLNRKVVQLNTHAGENMNNHGTTMACIISAFDEKNGKLGIAPMVDKIFSYQLDIDENKSNVKADDLLKALDALDKAEVQVINMSFTCDEMSFFPVNDSGRRVQEKIDTLIKKDIILVCATGNNRKHNSSEAGRFPAGYKNVLTVTGHNFSGVIDFESNCWNGVTISTFQEHYFDDEQSEKSNGTSGAAAIISGCIACIYNKINSPKIQNLKSIFSQMPLLKDSFGSHFSVPKFDTIKFINLSK